MLAVSLYNVRRDQNDAHPVYDGFELNDTKDMDKGFGDDIKPGAHGHVCCFAL